MSDGVLVIRVPEPHPDNFNAVLKAIREVLPEGCEAWGAIREDAAHVLQIAFPNLPAAGEVNHAN